MFLEQIDSDPILGVVLQCVRFKAHLPGLGLAPGILQPSHEPGNCLRRSGLVGVPGLWPDDVC